MPSRLHAHVAGRGPRIVLVHGFTQTLASWGIIASQLQGSYEVVQLDLPGHGGSDAVSLDFAAAADAIGETGGRASYVGYSLGGRLCLQLGLQRPELVSSLVLLGASPGIAEPAERVRRRASDEALARGLERDGLESFLEHWLALPLFATLAPDLAGGEERLANTVPGLAGALRRLGTAEMEPLWGRLGELAMPVLAMAGALDLRYSGIAKEMVEQIGSSAELAIVPDAGHPAHLEAPERVLHELLSFWERHGIASAR